MPYAGVNISPAFRERWLSGKHVGVAKPRAKVEIRRGHFHPRWHSFAEAGVLGRAGHVANSQRLWYRDWMIDSDWEEIEGVKNVRLEQSFDNKGVCAATIDIDNLQYRQQGSGLGIWHTIERGFYSPLRGYVYPGRPSVPDIQENEWFMKLPNAQIRVWVGYGADTLAVAFLGLIDDMDVNTQGQVMQVIARDFGGVMVDENVYGWAKDRASSDPLTFTPSNIVDEVTQQGGGARATSEQPGYPPSNAVVEGRHLAWWGGPNADAAGVDWIDIHVPAGRYRGIYFDGDFDGQDLYIGFYLRPRGSKHTGYAECAWQPNSGEHFLIGAGNMTHDDTYTDSFGNHIPVGWVNFAHGADVIGKAGFGSFPVWHVHGGTRKGKGVHVKWGGTLLVGANSVIRIAITPLPRAPGHINGRPVHRAGIRRVKGERVDRVDKALTADDKYVVIDDVSEIAEAVFRWCGFKEWEVETTGTSLRQNYVVGQDKSFMDIMDDLCAQTGYVFFVAEPTDDGEVSVGRPIFRQNRVWEPTLDHTEQLTDKNLLEDVKFKWTNADQRKTIRVRGKQLSRKNGGRPMWDDSIPRAQFTYVPPWSNEVRMAGVEKVYTHYDPYLETIDQCEIAAYLIALKIAFTLYTAIIDCAGSPSVGLDSFVSVVDRASGVNGRLYVTNRIQEFTSGQDAKYTLELGGALPDTPDVQAINAAYWRAVATMDPNGGPHNNRRKRPPHKHKSAPPGTYAPGTGLTLA